MGGRERDNHARKYVHLSTIGVFLNVSHLILFQSFLLFFFKTHFYPWTFLCCCGAVFNTAVAFNGDLSAWDVGQVTSMQSSTYTSPRWVFFWMFLTLFCFNHFSSFFSKPIFILELFFVAVVQCFTLFKSSMVISPPGMLGKWRTWITVRILFSPAPRTGFF